MAIPTRGTRRIVVGGVKFRWRVICDRGHWDKGYITDVRAVPAVQLLIADSMASRRRKGDPLSQPFTPSFARKLILGGLAKSWMPKERIRKAVMLDEEEARRATGGV